MLKHGHNGLLDLLSGKTRKDGNPGTVICAEGYLFQFERRGYLKAGAFVPEVVIEHPDLLKALYLEMVHAGSDVVEAFTYYAHREKLRVIGRESDLEKINRTALKLAREAANETGTVMAGGISNTTIYMPNQPDMDKTITNIFKEQIEWAVEEGADYIVGETFSDLGEAMLALEAIKKFGNGLPAVITLVPHRGETTNDGFLFPEALQKLEQAGAAVVGLNCGRGPFTTIPLLAQARKVCKGPLACVPVPYRTGVYAGKDAMTWHDLRDERTGAMAFPTDLDPFCCSRSDIVEFTRQCLAIGVQYLGLCCGNSAHYTRTLAETLGRKPPASRYTADMSNHFIFGNDGNQTDYNKGKLKQKLLTD